MQARIPEFRWQLQLESLAILRRPIDGLKSRDKMRMYYSPPMNNRVAVTFPSIASPPFNISDANSLSFEDTAIGMHRFAIPLCNNAEHHK